MESRRRVPPLEKYDRIGFPSFSSEQKSSSASNFEFYFRYFNPRRGIDAYRCDIIHEEYLSRSARLIQRFDFDAQANEFPIYGVGGVGEDEYRSVPLNKHRAIHLGKEWLET